MRLSGFHRSQCSRLCTPLLFMDPFMDEGTRTASLEPVAWNHIDSLSLSLARVCKSNNCVGM